MTSIEALWIVKFGDVASPTQARNGGVVVFESGRAFGGDSGFAYVGDYSILGGKFEGNLTAARFDPDIPNIFGVGADELQIQVLADVTHDQMIGSVRLADGADALPLFMISSKERP